MINMRVGRPGHLQFMSRESEQSYDRQVEAARARQTVRFAVAPLCTVPTSRGVLEVGAEVSLEDFDDAVDERGAVILRAHERLYRLVRDGIVIERY
jgi:hypothetical protein